MDNRLGERVPLQWNVRFTSTRPRLSNIGEIVNLSRSGAFIAGCELQLFSLVTVWLDADRGPQSEGITAYVSRVASDGVGIEWCEYAPATVGALVRKMTKVDSGDSEAQLKGVSLALFEEAEPALQAG